MEEGGRRAGAHGLVSAACLGCNFLACTPDCMSEISNSYSFPLRDEQYQLCRRTSTHSLNSGNRSPTDASTGPAHSSKAHSATRARTCGLNRILPIRSDIMLSSFMVLEGVKKGLEGRRWWEEGVSKLGWVVRRGAVMLGSGKFRDSTLATATARCVYPCFQGFLSGGPNTHHTL